MSAYSDLGPQGPTRMEVCLLATEVMRMAQQAREMCGTGPGLDLPRAIRTLRKARDLMAGIASEPEGDDADG
ncbi:hypothetical protein [Novosphingobium sp. AP12]|uniref:hypothetical protein n=1 Tax=Novosphingobium sp. AP12 TaxID=1144305 RepID=UPI0002720AE0|nr:hypothetical protein [Novosphingobium sp. AP12]EJL25589.1 hypothetical protein PMI02_03187 [Novosphingobium sp. AP12]